MSIRFLAAVVLTTVSATSLEAQADMTDVEMAHVAVTASNIDIAYAHLALALSENTAVRRFAETMIRDHTAVNEQVAALARELGVQAQDNALSRQLLTDAAVIKDRLSRLRGAEFDHAYARNELEYHRAVNGVVADAFVPGADHAKVKQAFEAALAIFRGHEKHAEMVVTELGAGKR